MNTEAFTGRAQAYTIARPGYPETAIEYIRSLAPPDAVFADIGAGTGKFTELLARHGYKIFAVEPNADMREQLAITLAPFPRAKIVEGSAEATALPDRCADAIANAQALNRFDTEAFRSECRRIGRDNPVVITVYNDDETKNSARYKKSTGALYRNPAIREFPNPVYYTREKWLLYYASMEGVPTESDPGYREYFAEMNGKFDRENADGILCENLITVVYCERLE